MRVAVVVLVVLAGCSSPPGEREDSSEAEPCLRGILVDEHIVPVPDATLTVRETGATTTTDDHGAFCLELPEGEANIDVLAGQRHGTMRCQTGGEEPAGCNRVIWA